jgi:hypothetical protein
MTSSASSDAHIIHSIAVIEVKGFFNFIGIGVAGEKRNSNGKKYKRQSDYNF